jgi:hypothetical protein
MDEPLAWGVLPAEYFLLDRPVRWSLGASDICFTNPWVHHDLPRVIRCSSIDFNAKKGFSQSSSDKDRSWKPLEVMGLDNMLWIGPSSC